MNRALCVTFAVVLCLWTTQASAQDAGFGLGGIVGDPTGISLKGYVGPTAAIDGGIGFGFISGNRLAVYADFLWEIGLKDFDRAGMVLHFGVGPKVGIYYDLDDNFWLGARAPVGLTFQFTQRPLDVFVEVAAGLWIIQDVDFDLDVGAGARYWF